MSKLHSNFVALERSSRQPALSWIVIHLVLLSYQQYIAHIQIYISLFLHPFLNVYVETVFLRQ